MNSNIVAYYKNIDVKKDGVKLTILYGILTGFLVETIIYALDLLGIVDMSVFINTGVQSVLEESIFLGMMLVLVLSPVLETVIFQFGIFEILYGIIGAFKRNKTKWNTIIPAVITITIFALSHNFSIAYIIIIFLPSILFQLTYIKFRNEQNMIKGIMFTMLQHFIYNASTVLFSMFYYSLFN
ncbi:MAG: CPBP family glutamic-type intramembrane protease [Caloramator sp.]|nr:CPBP family glutamic-type intramembrane protease [Caloramator sp.]